jgi:hypothetical protein
MDIGLGQQSTLGGLDKESEGVHFWDSLGFKEFQFGMDLDVTHP